MKNVWFSICVLLGIAIFCVYYQYWYLAAVVLAGLLLLARFKREYSVDAHLGLFIFSAALLYLCLFMEHPGDLDSAPRDVQWTGTIVSRPRLEGNKCRFILKPDQPSPHMDRVQVFCSFPARVEKHQQVKLRGSLRTPDKPGNPGEFNYAAYLSYEDIYYTLNIESPEDLEVLDLRARWLGSLENFRQNSLLVIRSVLPPQQASILIGMLLGDVQEIDDQEYDEYQKTGIVHVFSVSGMHVAFLALLCGWLLKRLDCPRRAVFIISTAVLVLYGTLADWPVPVIRSVIMTVLSLLAIYGGREGSLLNNLGLAGIIILLLNPKAIFQISFQLSFAAAWGLIYLYPRWRILYSSRNVITDLLLLSAAAQVAILPLLAYYFNLISPVSLLANLLLGYLSEVVVILGFLFLLLGMIFTPLGVFMLELAGLLIEIIRWTNPFLLELPLAYLWVATPTCASILVYYCGLFAASGSFSRRYSWTGVVLMSGFLILCFLPASWYHRGSMELVFLDVGQGDCMLIKTPGGEFILVDGGGSNFSDVGGRKVLPYLRNRGINSLLLVINTHPDVDHLAGLNALVKEMPVQAAAIPARIAHDKAYGPFREIVRQEGIPLIEMGEDWMLDEGGWSLASVSARASAGQTSDINQQSLVLRCQWGEFSALLTGDVGIETLARLDEEMKLAAVDVLKIPHHGSKYSLYPALYRSTGPAFAIISVGAHNTFGHPSSAVLKTLEEENISILRTDKCGAVLFRSWGSGYDLYTGPEEIHLTSIP